MKYGSGKIMYCAIPTRMRDFGPRAKEIARLAGYSPVLPFDALSYEDSEGGPLSRERTLKFDLELMRICDVLGIFGVSAGVMGELRDALDRGMDVRVLYGHDKEWEKEYEALIVRDGDIFAEIRGPNQLIALVGQSAVGKTFWYENLLSHYGSFLKMVKNTTTRQLRPGRDKEDRATYNFISREEFEQGIVTRTFLEHDEYLGNYYGSSMDSIRTVLKYTNGIFSVTPSGARALNERRFEINLTILFLKPANISVIKRNLELRGITDVAEQTCLIKASEQFQLPPDIDHKTIEITGNTYDDRNKFLSIVSPLLKAR